MSSTDVTTAEVREVLWAPWGRLSQDTWFRQEINNSFALDADGHVGDGVAGARST